MAKASKRAGWRRGGPGRSMLLVLAAVMVGGLLISPAGAHVGGLSHLINKHLKPLFYTKAQANKRYYTKAQANNRFYTKTQANNRFVNHCDEEEFPWVQNLAQATINGDSVDTDEYDSNGLMGEIDCAALATGVLVKKMSTGVYRVAFPEWWTDPDFVDDLPLAVVQALDEGGASASYVPIGEPGLGTVIEVHTVDAAGTPTDTQFHVVVTGWAFDFFGIGDLGAATQDGKRGISEGYSSTRG